MPLPDASHSSAALPLGYEFQGFRIERVLGHGGYGITYLVYERQLNRRIALKELFPRHIVARIDRVRVAPRSPAERAKFEQARLNFIAEARQIAQFHHDNIIRVHHLVEANQTAYFAMDYVEGINFRQWIAVHRAPQEEELARILLPLLDGLGYIHARGILHQDVSPENILVNQKGSPVLIDFGSSRGGGGFRDPRQPEVTRAGYSALELYMGSPRGPWTDLYALAGVMAHAIRGQTPPSALDRRSATQPEVSLAERYRRRYRPSFLHTLDRAFSLQAKDRPQSTSEFRRLLATPAPPAKASILSDFFHRYRWALLGAAVLAVAATILFFPRPPKPDPNKQTITVPSSSDITPPPGLQAQGYRSLSGMQLVIIPALTTADRRIFFGQNQVRCADYKFYVPGYDFYIPFSDDIQLAGLTMSAAGQYPVVRISQTDASAFCQTMTARETQDGLLPAGAFFRLPTSAEWSEAAHESSGTPHPWGDGWPPRTESGAPLANLADASLARVGSLQRLYSAIEDYDDGFPTTAPVGSFPALHTTEGLLDFGSNVEEWCSDLDDSTACSRGASWRDADGAAAVTSRVDRNDRNAAYDWIGFRVVLELPTQH
jgi:serine/threonine protein kinase